MTFWVCVKPLHGSRCLVPTALFSQQFPCWTWEQQLIAGALSCLALKVPHVGIFHLWGVQRSVKAVIPPPYSRDHDLGNMGKVTWWNKSWGFLTDPSLWVFPPCQPWWREASSKAMPPFRGWSWSEEPAIVVVSAKQIQCPWTSETARFTRAVADVNKRGCKTYSWRCGDKTVLESTC